MSKTWKCVGCGAPSPGRQRACDCPTCCLYRAGDENILEYSVKIDPPPFPRASGISRVADNERALLVSFARRPSDDEMRAIHARLKEETG